MMRRWDLLLLAAQVCAARFSIHHDLLAYPQFEVVLSDTYISEAEAKTLIDPGHGDTKDVDIQVPVSQASGGDGSEKVGETYEIMTMNQNKYLCAIPVIETPPAPNKTATELAKAEEARELARASTHGWELVNGLDGTCLYYVSGWWSYSFCYGQDVVQFHALPTKQGPPVKDPNSQEYVLGRLVDPAAAAATTRKGRSQKTTPAAANKDKSAAPPNTELQVKGDQRFLVQRMDDGTTCDLTNRPRTIEIQYHCSPGSTQDRIGWVKEVTTCAYLMLVNTPRLCSDAAFQPPPQTRANVISCRTIVAEAEQAAWHAQKTLEAKAAMIGQQRTEEQAPVVVGGVVVGSRRILGSGEDGKEPAKLQPPKHFTKGDGPLIEVIAMGGTTEDDTLQIMTTEEMEKLDLDPKTIEEIKRRLEEMTGDKSWKLEVVEAEDQPGPQVRRELRAVIDADDEDEGDAAPGDSKDSGAGSGKAKRKDSTPGQGQDQGEEGSEEKFFKEEL